MPLVTTVPQKGESAKVYDIPEADLSNYESVEATQASYEEAKTRSPAVRNSRVDWRSKRKTCRPTVTSASATSGGGGSCTTDISTAGSTVRKIKSDAPVAGGNARSNNLKINSPAISGGSDSKVEWLLSHSTDLYNLAAFAIPIMRMPGQ